MRGKRMWGRWYLIGVLAVCLMPGCSRSFYREWADGETATTIEERGVPLGGIRTDTQLLRPPESRLHDPASQDFPPRPPDDPMAREYMDAPNGIRGSSRWNDWGVADKLEYDGWEAQLPRDDKGAVPLTAAKAVELALANSREYQTQRENVYLSALALTLNRFEFDLRWFGRNNTAFTHFGTSSRPNESNLLTSNSSLGFNRNFAAGGQLLVDFVNSIAIEFTGANQTRVSSNFVVNFLQPLLRGAGRYVRLENLTQAERDLLYTVRSFARFRKEFYVNVAVVGYLDLLLQKQAIRNLKLNLKNQEFNYRFYQELFKGGKASVVNVDQSLTALLNAEQQIVNAEANFQNSLDAFKITLGLPPRIVVDIDDSTLNQFQLQSDRTEKMQELFEKFLKDRYAELSELPPVDKIKGSYRELGELLKQISLIVDEVEGEWKRWEVRLQETKQADSPLKQRERETFEDFRATFPKIRADLEKLQGEVTTTGEGLSRPEEAKPGWDRLLEKTRVGAGLVDQVASIQTQVRIYAIELREYDIDELEAIAFAKENRLDLMNAKAQVTDAWRRVQVTANALQADLNVLSNINLGTDPDHNNPFNFAAEASRYTFGLQLDTPLNRFAERNAYRASLIAYQRARRNYMQLSDSIEQSLRREFRLLRAARVNFQISRQQVIAAARQVEGAKQDILSSSRGAGGLGTSSVTLQILQALENLLSARNQLVGNYLNFEQLRIRTLFDMERLQLDDQGIYIDERSTNTPDRPAESGPRGRNDLSPFEEVLYDTAGLRSFIPTNRGQSPPRTEPDTGRTVQRNP